ncbi:MAG: LysR substrate-binding domain-containing protein [Myxococcota bacterium]
MTLTELRYLVALAETRHFGRAAEACFVTQPTLSAGLKKLEDHLGVQLVERTSKRVALTPVGAAVVDQARRVLDECTAIEAIAREGQEPLSGPFHLGVIPTLGPYTLPWVVPPLRAAHPELELTLREDLTDNLLEALRAHVVDAALLALPVPGDDLRSEAVFDEPFWLAAPADHPLAARKRVRQSDLQGHRVLLLGEGHCFRDQALEVCHEVGADSEAGDFRATSLETLFQMVRAGLGCTLLPALALPAHRGDEAVALHPFVRPAPMRRIAVVWRKSFPRPGDCALLAQSIREHLPEGLKRAHG